MWQYSVIAAAYRHVYVRCQVERASIYLILTPNATRSPNRFKQLWIVYTVFSPYDTLACILWNWNNRKWFLTNGIPFHTHFYPYTKWRWSHVCRQTVISLQSNRLCFFTTPPWASNDEWNVDHLIVMWAGAQSFCIFSACRGKNPQICNVVWYHTNRTLLAKLLCS